MKKNNSNYNSDSEDEGNIKVMNKRETSFYRINNVFVSKHKYHLMLNSKDSKGRNELLSKWSHSIGLDNHNKKTKWDFPNYSVLEDLITVDAIRCYPKLALLIFDVIFPYIEAFNNVFVSFLSLC